MRQRRFGPVVCAGLLLAVLVLQVAVVADLRVFGANGDLLLVVTLAVALREGPDRGMTWGFGIGVLHDLLLDTPFGLSALVYALVGYVVGVVGATLIRPAGWSPVGLAVLAGATSVGIYVGVAHLIGVPFSTDGLLSTALVVGIWSGALILPAMAALRRLAGTVEPDSIALALPGGARRGRDLATPPLKP